MDQHLRYEAQVKNVQKETGNSALLNDVVTSEFEQHPGQNEHLTRQSRLSLLEQSVLKNKDGKTWINRR